MIEQVTTSPSSEAIVTVSQQVTQSQPKIPPHTQLQMEAQPQSHLDAQKESHSKEIECGLAITDPSIGSINANPLMVSSSPSHPNHQKHDEIQKTPQSALGTTHQQSQINKVSIFTLVFAHCVESSRRD